MAQAFSTLSIGFGVEARRHREETREEPLLVEGQVADGPDRGDVDGRRLRLHRGAGLLGGAPEDLGDRHPEELPELRLLVGGDVDRLHELPPSRSHWNRALARERVPGEEGEEEVDCLSRPLDDEGVAAAGDDGELAARESAGERFPAGARHRTVVLGQEDEDRAGDPRNERGDVEPLERAEQAREALEPHVREMRHERAPRDEFRACAAAHSSEKAKAEMRS